MSRRASAISMVGVVLMFWSVSIVGAAEISSISGGMVTLDVGMKDGVQKGMTGLVKHTIEAGGAMHTLDIARFEVMSVGTGESRARLTEVGPGWELTAGMVVAFDQELRPPEPEATVLVIHSNVSGDTAYLDGRRVGSTPQRVEVDPGSHTVRVEKNGYEPAEQRVTVAKGKIKVVRASLSGVPEVTTDPVELLRRGNAASDRQDWAVAVEAYTALLGLVPGHPIAQERGAIAQGKVRQARAAAEAERQKVEAAERKARAERARLDQERRNLPLYRETVKTYLGSNDWESAVNWLRKIAAVDPADGYLGSVLQDQRGAAERFIESGQFDQAVARCDRVLEISPNDRVSGIRQRAIDAKAEAREHQLQELLEEGDRLLAVGDKMGAREAWVRVKAAEPEFFGLEERFAKIDLRPGLKWVDPAIGIDFCSIPAGSFQMGSYDGDSDEKPVHRVKITRGFWMGETEVTQGQWKAVMGSNPSKFKNCGDDCPVEQVSWYDAVRYANVLSKKAGLTPCYSINGENVSFKGQSCEGYRLPTEAEWEYAARAGGNHRYSGSDDLGAVAWYSNNSGDRTHAVGRKRANAWGLRDMSGNVWEWCWDWYGDYPSGSVTDPTGPSWGSDRVERGGGWYYFAGSCRSASRFHFSPGARYGVLGFRLARTASE